MHAILSNLPIIFHFFVFIYIFVIFFFVAGRATMPAASIVAHVVRIYKVAQHIGIHRLSSLCLIVSLQHELLGYFRLFEDVDGREFENGFVVEDGCER